MQHGFSYSSRSETDWGWFGRSDCDKKLNMNDQELYKVIDDSELKTFTDLIQANEWCEDERAGFLPTWSTHLSTFEYFRRRVMYKFHQRRTRSPTFQSPRFSPFEILFDWLLNIQVCLTSFSPTYLVSHSIWKQVGHLDGDMNIVVFENACKTIHNS